MFNTEISVGKLMLKYFTPLTSEEQQVGVVSDENATEVSVTTRKETTDKVRKNKGKTVGSVFTPPRDPLVV